MTRPAARVERAEVLEWDGDPIEAHQAAQAELERLARDQARLYEGIALPLWIMFAAAIGAACIVVQFVKWIAR